MKATPKTEKADARRRAEIAKIKIAQKRLGLDDETYRAVVARVCNGKRSAADLDENERGALLDYFKSTGFREGDSYSKKLDDFGDSEPQARLIRALWADCASMKIIRNPTEQSLRRFIRRVAKIDDIGWLTATDAAKVINALRAMKTRHFEALAKLRAAQ